MKESTIIRRMMESDIEEISQAFIHQGWPGRKDILTSYFQDQENGESDVLVADLDGSVAGYITILPDAKHGPFVGVYPELTDFNVFEPFRNRGCYRISYCILFQSGLHLSNCRLLFL